MIKLYINCSVLIIGNVEVGPDIGMKFHQEVMEIVSYDTSKILKLVNNCFPGITLVFTQSCYKASNFKIQGTHCALISEPLSEKELL